MTGQGSLWDYAADRAGEQDPEDQRLDAARREAQEDDERDRSRHRSITRLRATGHWLTLLQVARTIPQPFTLNDISVAVWQARPEVFGMRGYPHPDNHKVHYILYGSRGLIAKGIIKRVREGLFRLPEGLDVEALATSGRESAETPLPEPAPKEQRDEG
jgi:hypothetical protein